METVGIIGTGEIGWRMGRLLVSVGHPVVGFDIRPEAQKWAREDALVVRSHYDSMTIMIPGAPLPDEIAIVCCFANRGRLNHRIGGHSVDKIIGKDGLR